MFEKVKEKYPMIMFCNHYNRVVDEGKIIADYINLIDSIQGE
jgi:hypothetical protein